MLWQGFVIGLHCERRTHRRASSCVPRGLRRLSPKLRFCGGGLVAPLHYPSRSKLGCRLWRRWRDHLDAQQRCPLCFAGRRRSGGALLSGQRRDGVGADLGRAARRSVPDAGRAYCAGGRPAEQPQRFVSAEALLKAKFRRRLRSIAVAWRGRLSRCRTP